MKSKQLQRCVLLQMYAQRRSMLPAVPTDLPFYVASTRGNFTLNISAASFAAAEESCRAHGGRLAYFSTHAEQAEVRLRGWSVHWVLATPLEPRLRAPPWFLHTTVTAGVVLCCRWSSGMCSRATCCPPSTRATGLGS